MEWLIAITGLPYEVMILILLAVAGAFAGFVDKNVIMIAGFMVVMAALENPASPPATSETVPSPPQA